MNTKLLICVFEIDMNNTLTLKLELPSLYDCTSSPVCQYILKWGISMIVINVIILLLLISILIVVGLNHTLAVKTHNEMLTPAVVQTGLTTTNQCNI